MCKLQELQTNLIITIKQNKIQIIIEKIQNYLTNKFICFDI